MSQELKLQLKPGDQIVATEITHYTHRGAEGKQSQWIRDLIMVNNPRMHDSVGGTGLYDGPGKRENRERPSLGLGSLMLDGTYRRATPDDPGFMATREQWIAHADQEARRLRMQSFICGALAILSIGMLAMDAVRPEPSCLPTSMRHLSPHERPSRPMPALSSAVNQVAESFRL